MKNLNLLFFMLVISLQAQQNIDISRGYNSIVIFNSDISDINGNPSISNEEEYIVTKISDRIIQFKIDSESKPSRGTNCTVITEDGKLYLLNINLKSTGESKFIEADPKLAKDINSNDEYIVSSMIEDDEKKALVSIVKDSSKNDIAHEKVIENCKGNEDRKKNVLTTPYKSKNIILTIRDIAYEDEKLYLFFDVKNKGEQSFQVEWVRLKATTKLDETGSSQIKILPAYYIHNQPKKIKGKSKYRFIVVLEKTVINKHKQIAIDIKELSGERNLILNIDDEIINNPNEL